LFIEKNSMSKIVFKAGEATVFSEGKDVTAAMPEILIGAVDRPGGTAVDIMLAQRRSRTELFVVRDINQFVRLAAMLVRNLQPTDSINIELFGGVVQAATADAIVDCVIEGIIPKEQVNDLCTVSLVWIDTGCAALEKEGKLDKADMYK